MKQKALEPQCRHCYIRKIEINILIEYPDYKSPNNKGAEGAIFCENIVECYQANIRCRYSGLSPLYPDPFLPRDEEAEEDTHEVSDSADADTESEEPPVALPDQDEEEEEDEDDDWPRPRRS